MTGLAAGAGAAGCALLVVGLAAGAGWLDDGFAAGVGWAGAAVGLGAAVLLALDEAGAAEPVARFGTTWDGPAGLPPVPTSTTFRDER